MKNKPFFSRATFALAGIKSAFSNEKSFRAQVVFAGGAFVFLALFRPTLVWWALVGLTVVLVLAAELINTALEHLADHLHPDQHPKIKIVKDCAAGAVLVLSFGALWVGLLAFISVMIG